MYNAHAHKHILSYTFIHPRRHTYTHTYIHTFDFLVQLKISAYIIYIRYIAKIIHLVVYNNIITYL